MPRIAGPLALDAYRTLIALDEPFTPRVVGSEQVDDCLDLALEHLKREGLAHRLDARHGSQPDMTDRLRLLRTLLTVRGPASLPDAVHDAIDAVLQWQRRRRPVVDAGRVPRLPPHAGHPSCLALWQGDITTIAADAIVNAANEQLLGCFQPSHACIDNAIHWAAGPRLREDCARIMDAQGGLEPSGHAKATRAYNLPSRYVLHTVGPIVRGSVSDEDETTLARCYRACLDVAGEIRGVRSVVFCGVSTGVFGYPREAAARIALQTARAWQADHPGGLDVVVFNAFSDRDLAAYRAAIEDEPS